MDSDFDAFEIFVLGDIIRWFLRDDADNDPLEEEFMDNNSDPFDDAVDGVGEWAFGFGNFTAVVCFGFLWEEVILPVPWACIVVAAFGGGESR